MLSPSYFEDNRQQYHVVLNDLASESHCPISCSKDTAEQTVHMTGMSCGFNSIRGTPSLAVIKNIFHVMLLAYFILSYLLVP
jgi:hypothetical protein